MGAYGAMFLGLALVCAGQEGSSSQGASSEQVAESAAGAQRGRRDPFAPLIRGGGTGQTATRVCPAGVEGVQISGMNVDGIVKSGSGMIAVISTSQGRVYFIREGDRLCDGNVERITMDGVVLRERGQDAFGKPVDRLVTKRLYPSAGEGR